MPGPGVPLAEVGPPGPAWAPPFRKNANLCAICGASLRNCESELNLMTTDFFANMSFTVMLLLAASMELIVPAMLRNVPEITSSAAISFPSALRVPRARNWSPVLIWSIVPFCASANFTELGE